MSTERNTRPLTARSVLLSLLLGTDPPRLPASRLVRAASLFGIAEGTSRTALSRMAAQGDVEATDGWYRLSADRLLARQARQAASRRATTRPWRAGRWVQAVVTANGPRPAPERAELRATLTHARLAELREGVWMRPDNLPRHEPTPHDDLTWLGVTTRGDDIDLAARLWDLPAWAERARALGREMRRLTPPLEHGDPAPLAEGFVVNAATLRHLQADPLLPDALLPRAWPGSEVREQFERFDAAYRAVLRAWFAAEH